MATVLALSGQASLVQDAAGVIAVSFEGTRYLLADRVPAHIMSGNTHPLKGRFNAGSYVTSCMLEKYGPNVDDWAFLARRFLFADFRNATA